MGRYPFKAPTKVVRIRINIFERLKQMSANSGKPMAVILEEILIPALKNQGYEVRAITIIRPQHFF